MGTRGRTGTRGAGPTGMRPDGTKVQVTLNAAVAASPRAEHDSGRHRGIADTLHSQVKDWPTPSVGDVTGSRTVPSGTTATGRRPDGTKAQIGLQTAVRASAWPTPTARDWKAGDCRAADVPPNGLLGRVALVGAPAGALSPAWVCRLMGFPDDWTIIDGPPAAAKRSTPASPRARRRASP